MTQTVSGDGHSATQSSSDHQLISA